MGFASTTAVIKNRKDLKNNSGIFANTINSLLLQADAIQKPQKTTTTTTTPKKRVLKDVDKTNRPDVARTRLASGAKARKARSSLLTSQDKKKTLG